MSGAVKFAWDAVCVCGLLLYFALAVDEVVTGGVSRAASCYSAKCCMFAWLGGLRAPFRGPEVRS